MSSHRRPDQPKSSLTLWLSNQLGVDRMLCHEIADKLLSGRLTYDRMMESRVSHMG
jgi:hypothetical protein